MAQLFKSIYFPDYSTESNEGKSFTLAFSEKELDLYEILKGVSSLELRNLLSAQTLEDLKTLADSEHLAVNTYCIWKLSKELAKTKADYSNGDQLDLFSVNPIHVTFEGGKELPFQSWYPYLEGYSPDFVESIIASFIDKNAKTIYDPFSGTGTTPFAASSLRYTTYYSEINPVLQFLSKVKFQVRNLNNKDQIIDKLNKVIGDLERLVMVNEADQELITSYKNTFGKSKFFDDKTFSNILKLKSFLRALSKKEPLIADLISIATMASLVKCSLLKRQGDLRYKTKSEIEKGSIPNLFSTIRENLEKIASDIAVIKKAPEPILISEDARAISELPRIGIDAVITSPPYLNGTNYFRNTKIELWFLGYLKSSEDLTNFRRKAVTAGINDVSFKEEKEINDELLNRLLVEIEKTAYDKRIPKMIHDYFADMKFIFEGMKKHLNKNATLAIDLGDSIYSGIHVKTDEILISILKNLGYEFNKSITLRRRISKNGDELKQVLLIFNYPHVNGNGSAHISGKKYPWEKSWEEFKRELPHQKEPFSKRNWGNPLHSLCSYQGKLKPSIANMLVSIFVPPGGSVLDIFGGVGTIPLEAALQGKKTYTFDISNPAVAISRAKLSKISPEKVKQLVKDLETYINNTKVKKDQLDQANDFGFNKKLIEYFHPKTLEEIILARSYFEKNGYDTAEKSLILAAILHILHGNRPYALSRRSHGITPFAPTGEFTYKNLIEKLNEKLDRSINGILHTNFVEGESLYQDTLKSWPNHIQNLNAIITSPPFFDSTRFYLANWMRMWFAGWDEENFRTDTVNFIEELQKKDFSVYDGIFKQASERLNKNGVFVMHLGKSNKCDMAKVLSEKAEKWLRVYDIFEESVRSGESHGVTDKGRVVDHQYLVLGQRN